MSKPLCDVLVEMRNRIESGEDPEHVIPYNFECLNDDDYIEVLHYALQILPDGSPRKEACKRKLKSYARR